MRITILFCLLFTSSLALGKEGERSLSHVEDIRLAMEINSDLYMSTKSALEELNLENEHISNEEINKVEQMLLHEANNIIEKVAFDDKDIAKKSLRHIKWRNLAVWFIEKLKSMRSFIRQKGMFYVGYALGSNILQFTIPSVLVYMDRPLLAFAVFHIVGDVPVYLYYKGATSLLYHNKMIKMMGGYSKYREYKKMQKELRKSLSVRDIKDWIYTPSRDSSVSIKVVQESLISSIKNRMGFQSNQLNFYNLKKFFNSDLLEKYPDISLLFNSNEIDSQMKTLFIAVKVLKDFSQEDLLLFKGQFSESFFKTDFSSDIDPIKDWIEDCFRSNEISELRFKLLNPPSEIKYARQYNLLWKEIFLPKLSENFSLVDFNDYRSLVLSYDQFFVEQIKNKIVLADSSFLNAMANYMDLAFSQRGPSCAEKFDRKLGELVERVKNKIHKKNEGH